MTGVLILAHGSRRKATEATLEAVAAMVRDELPGAAIETAYMEFSERSIAAGLQALIDRGAQDIVVAPYFLFDGVHIREDIPAELEAFRQEHPEVCVRLGATLGADRRLAALLVDRIRESL